MQQAESIWHSKTDEEVCKAAERLDDFTEEGDLVIRAELKRRGLPEPAPPVGQCQNCGRSVSAKMASTTCVQCGAALPASVIELLNLTGKPRGLSPRSVIFVSALATPPVWFVASALFIGAFGWFFEEVLGWSKEENSWRQGRCNLHNRARVRSLAANRDDHRLSVG
jgi:hypothetical protein